MTLMQPKRSGFVTHSQGVCPYLKVKCIKLTLSTPCLNEAYLFFDIIHPSNAIFP